MKCLLLLTAVLLFPAAAFCQTGQAKPAAVQTPAEELVGVWDGAKEFGGEWLTFMADGRAVVRQNHQEKEMRYKLDATATPWKLDLTLTEQGVEVTIFAVCDFPKPGQFRMAPPSPDEEKRPGLEALQKSKVVLNRIALGPDGGIFQVVEAHRKRLTGTWETIVEKKPVTMTFAADGTYVIESEFLKDKGRYRLDVSKVPCGLDFLSSEGLGPTYTIYESSADGPLKIGRNGRKPEDRPKEFTGEGGEVSLTKRKPAGK